MQRVTMLGLGIMGGGAAHNILKNKFDLTVWNRTQSKAATLVAHGARWADTPRAAVADADVVISFVADDDAGTRSRCLSAAAPLVGAAFPGHTPAKGSAQNA